MKWNESHEGTHSGSARLAAGVLNARRTSDALSHVEPKA